MTTFIQATADLGRIADAYTTARKRVTRRVMVCAGTGCMANGAVKVYNAFRDEIAKAGLNVLVELRAED